METERDMDLVTLCDEIGLQPQIKSQVLAFADGFDLKAVHKQLQGFLVYESMEKARTGLQAMLGEDTDHIKILACMLEASADAYDIYKEKGISDEIYFATMKCYPRFIEETYRMTGKYYFDRYWWTARQAGCHLFRIGTLEYEKNDTDDKKVIGLHIPSDADLSPAAVGESLKSAERFFATYYPEMKDAEYSCRFWLLYPRAIKFTRSLGARGHIRAISLANHIVREYRQAAEGNAG